MNRLIVLGTFSTVTGVALISWQGDKKQPSFRGWQLAYPLSAALLAGAGLLGWHSSNLFVIALAGVGYLVLFAALLWWSGVPEARMIVQRLLARRK